VAAQQVRQVAGSRKLWAVSCSAGAASC